jgi:F-type H+-transporting ATPase subunit b
LKTMPRFLSAFLVMGLLMAPSAVRLHAQEAGQPQQAGQAQQNAVPNENHMDAPEAHPEAETAEYRHSAMVAKVAGWMHVKTETAAQIFEDFNSGVLILVLVVVLVKVVPGVFRKRSATLQKDLTLAHEATEDANRRLAGVEARLSRLDTEIEAIRVQAEKDSVEDEKRIAAALEAERERIVASAEQEIAAVQAAAQRELKKFAADLAIDQAMRSMQLSPDTDRALVRDFSKGLSGGPVSGGASSGDAGGKA